jgi:4-aminobutyrate aminotransferase
MITESELAKLSYEGAPLIVTELPGPKARQQLIESQKYQPPTRLPGASTPPKVKEALEHIPVEQPASTPPLRGAVWDEARGATMKDIDGNIFIDLIAGIAVNSVGRVHPKVVEAAKKQLNKLMHVGIGNESPVHLELAKRLADIMPGGLKNHCLLYYVQGGSDAVETAIKYARAITGRSQIVAFEGAYHGVWSGSLALTTKSIFKSGFGPLIPGVIHMPYAYCYRCGLGHTYPECQVACARYLDYKLNTEATGAHDVAAVIVESLQGEGGYVDPPAEFFSIIKSACEKKGILFITDEVQSGAGRTGKMWAIENYGVTPDILIFGKGIGGDAPMAGVAVRKEYGEQLSRTIQPNTFERNAVSCAIAATNISLLSDKKMDLVGRVAKVGMEIKKKLIEESKDIAIVGEVRGKGFMLGVELVKNKETREPYTNVMAITNKVRERGIMVASCGRDNNTIRFMPPLVITREYFNKGVDIILDVLREEARAIS